MSEMLYKPTIVQLYLGKFVLLLWLVHIVRWLRTRSRI